MLGLRHEQDPRARPHMGTLLGELVLGKRVQQLGEALCLEEQSPHQNLV